MWRVGKSEHINLSLVGFGRVPRQRTNPPTIGSGRPLYLFPPRFDFAQRREKRMPLPPLAHATCKYLLFSQSTHSLISLASIFLILLSRVSSLVNLVASSRARTLARAEVSEVFNESGSHSLSREIVIHIIGNSIVNRIALYRMAANFFDKTHQLFGR